MHGSKIQIDKFLATIGFILIAVALGIIAINPPATGYEISIYNAYPSYFWIFIIGSIACGICILVHRAFSNEKSKWWIAGFSIIIFANLVVILLPMFRGYFISNMGDELEHLGMIKDIALTGHIGDRNVYPVSHILVSQISSICGLDSRLVIKIIPSVFYLLYMIGLYLLARQISGKFGQALLVSAFSSVLLFTYFNYLFLPTQLFLFLIPLVLFLFLRKSSSPSYATIFLILLLPMPFLHSLCPLFLVAIFLLFGLSILIHRFLAKRSHAQNLAISYPPGMVLGPALLVFIIFFMWFSNFALFRTTITEAYEWFAYGHGVPPVESMAEAWYMANFTIPEFIDLFIKNYGHDLLFSLLSLIAVFAILRRVFSSQGPPKLEEIFFSLLFLVFGLFYISTLFGAFIRTGQSIRIFCWSLLAATVLNGIVFHEWILRLRGKWFKVCVHLIAIIIMAAAVIGVFSMYYSPHIKQANLQTTAMDMYGMEWFFQHKSNDKTMCLEGLPSRALNAIYGFDAPKPESVGAFYYVLPHLGYEENKSVADYLHSSDYLVVTERIRAYKTILWPDVGVYTLNELNRLGSDPGVSMVYSNRELEIWRVSPAKDDK
jgi:hypothetical protein